MSKGSCLRGIGGTLKFLILSAICGTIVFGLCLTGERGLAIAGSVEAEPSEEGQGQPSSGTTYKWVDEKGTIHFSDQPMSTESEQVEVGPINAYRFIEAQPAYGDQVPPSRQTPERAHERSASRRPISAADYKFFNSALQSGDEVILSGRVSDGPECKSLHLSIRAQSNKGRSILATTVVKDVGWGSKLFRVVRRSPYPKSSAWPTWDITDVKARCAD